MKTLITKILIALNSLSAPVLLAQNGSSLEVPLNTPDLNPWGPTNGLPAHRLMPRNLHFSDCTPAPGGRCAPADNWFRDSMYSYDIGWVAHGLHSVGAAYIAQTQRTTPNTFGAFGQCFSATAGRGRVVELVGYVSAQHVYNGYAALWLRIDDAYGQTLFLDNMNGRGLGGVTNYVLLATSGFVPHSAAQICIGGLLTGAGAAYFDDFYLSYSN